MIGIAAALVMQVAAPASTTTPPGGDTTGYWQQRIAYTIVAQLDDGLLGARSQGTMKYVNNSPDTLREMYFHQYLNAFKPGSRWSAEDERENRVRFQNLREPFYGYERFTRAPVIDGVPVLVSYPGSPDSTVVHIRLPRPLPPGDSLSVDFAWDSRPSAVPRRQARAGRTYDFAQWFPKVAVYDRAGWRPNALIPAGEFYGEFGTYDVTIVAADDQVIAATGVVVSGDPGWARVSRSGPPWMPAVPANVPQGRVVVPPPGQRAVRFYAENVHHFGWSASPDYIYEGAAHPSLGAARKRYPTFDTVAVHVLYKPADDTTWGGGRVVQRTRDALSWLERLFGPYAYPQITNLHRIDAGGTEFPMMMMNGSPSYGLALHELGHVYAYGILANNEWRSGWMDEGLTDHQTRWAQRLAPQDNRRGEIPRELARIGTGYRSNVRPATGSDSVDFELLRLEMMGRSEPPGTSAGDFSEFGIYNRMIYGRASMMFGHLREMMGDSVFVAFLHDYYDRWAFRHVDESAMRAAASRAYGSDLGWFFDQWVDGTGLLNYGMGADTTVCVADRCITRVRVTRYGELRHPMPVGVRTPDGQWTFTRALAELDDQWVDVESRARPDSIALDPFHVTWDWDWRDNTDESWVGTISAPDVVFDWPFLKQESRFRTVVAVAPRIWYSGPQGLLIGAGATTNYFGLTDINRLLVGGATRGPSGASTISRLQFRAQADDVYLAPFMKRPLMNVGGSFAFLDGIARGTLERRWNLSPFVYANGPLIHLATELSGTYPVEERLLPEQWSNAHVTEVAARVRIAGPRQDDSSSLVFTLDAGAGYASARDASARSRGYGRALATLTSLTHLSPGERTLALRVNGGLAPRAPLHRAIFGSSRDPFETFENNYYRPRESLFKHPDVNVTPLGGARMRGLSPAIAFDGIVSTNVELGQKLARLTGGFGDLTFWGEAFGDAGVASGARAPVTSLAQPVLVDAGVGVRVRGRFYDRDVDLRLDAPLVSNNPFNPPAIGGLPSAIRWTVDWR